MIHRVITDGAVIAALSIQSRELADQGADLAMVTCADCRRRVGVLHGAYRCTCCGLFRCRDCAIAHDEPPMEPPTPTCGELVVVGCPGCEIREDCEFRRSTE